MKIKTEYLILAAIIICLSLYLVFQKTDEVGYILPDIKGIHKKDISKIEIKSGTDDPLMIHKKDNTWLIAPEDYPADSEKINGMVDVIDELSLTALVSEAENYGRYDLGNDKKIKVSAWAKDELVRSFDIGKAASTFRHTFVRIGEDKRVYHARENFRSKFDISVEKLRDKEVLSFNAADIHKLSIVNKEKALTLGMTELPVEVSTESEGPAEKAPDKEDEKKPAETSPVWQDQDGNRADKATVDKFISSLSGLSCESYITEKEKADFENMTPIYTVALTGTEEYFLKIFDKVNNDDTAYPAVSSHNQYPFMLAGFRAENIMKGITNTAD